VSSIRRRNREAPHRRSTWLLIKHRDQYASTKDVTQEEPRSAASQRLLAEIARDEGGDIERASRGIRALRRDVQPRHSQRQDASLG
jgi:hypothetical protein